MTMPRALFVAACGLVIVLFVVGLFAYSPSTAPYALWYRTERTWAVWSYFENALRCDEARETVRLAEAAVIRLLPQGTAHGPREYLCLQKGKQP